MQAVIEKIRIAIKEVMSLVVPKVRLPNQVTGGHQGMAVWKAPVVGWLKIYCYGGFQNEREASGIEVVVRDANGYSVDGVSATLKADR